MNKSELRRKFQMDFLESGQELIVGNMEDLPISIEKLVEIDENSPYVVKAIKSGLTAIIYKIEVAGVFYNLKRKRDEILVKNVDGETSFLNEVQRRKDFYELQKTVPELKNTIVETVYASFRHGFILSKWIEAEPIKVFNEDIYESIFSTLYQLECNGIFEWDTCLGNMLVNARNEVKFFDFGYCYRFNPLTDYNSDGLTSPLFHCAERIETRVLMQYFMDMEDTQGLEATIEAYASEKRVALKYYEMKLDWLEQNGADENIKDRIKDYIMQWKKALSSKEELNHLYMLESFRSYILDIHDDTDGKTCTINTIKKVDKVLRVIEEKYDSLKKSNGFFWGDEKLSKEELIDKYNRYGELVIKYQIF